MAWRNVGLWIILLLGMMLLLFSNVEAGQYSYSVDRFEISGNLLGYAYDEFDDGNVVPWSIWDGTASEAAGLLTLDNPGDFMIPVQSGGLYIQEERSCVAIGSEPFMVQGNKGDFTATSQWDLQVPSLNQFYGIEILSHYSTGPVREDMSLNIYNFDQTFADAIGVPAGLNIWFLKNSTIQCVTIDENDITGDIFLQLLFNDENNLLNASFSLNGGTTYQSPFSPFSSNLDNAIDAFWLLEAADFTYQPVPIPASLLLLGSGLVGLTGFRKKVKKS